MQLSPVNLASIGTTNRTVVADRGFGSVLGDVLQSTYPNWTLGVQIGYPLGTNTAHANLARAKLQYEQAQAQLKNMEMQVTTQVRAAARNVQTNQQRVQSARASRELQEKKLEAEEKKLAAGMSSPFFVFQAQRDLSLARTVEIQAISDYNKSLVDFEAVQQVPLNGGSAPDHGAGRWTLTELNEDRELRTSNFQVNSPGVEALGHHHHQKRGGGHRCSPPVRGLG